MRLDISFRNTRPREEVKRRAEALFSKLERFLDPASDATLTVAREHEQFVCEVHVKARGQVHKVLEEDVDLRTALDRMFHRIEETLRRAKEKKVDRWHAGLEGKTDGFVPPDSADEFEDGDTATA